MKPKHIEFFDNVLASFLTTIKVLLLSKFITKKINNSEGYKECIILGNGPSLTNFLNTHSEFLTDKAVFCVNFFVLSPQYEKVRPNYYVLSAPDFWQKDEKPGLDEKREKIFSLLASKTVWNIKLIVPFYAKNKSDWKKKISSNPNITVCYFNNTPIEGLPSFTYLLFKLRLGMPRPHNVLVASLSIILNMDFKTCYISGADHSWLNEIYVSTENKVYLNQKHFYDEAKNLNDKEAKPMYVGTSNKERKLHEILLKFYYSFRSYWDLRIIAKKKNIKIINLTSNSFIDAFERKIL